MTWGLCHQGHVGQQLQEADCIKRCVLQLHPEETECQSEGDGQARVSAVSCNCTQHRLKASQKGKHEHSFPIAIESDVTAPAHG